MIAYDVHRCRAEICDLRNYVSLGAQSGKKVHCHKQSPQYALLGSGTRVVSHNNPCAKLFTGKTALFETVLLANSLLLESTLLVNGSTMKIRPVERTKQLTIKANQLKAGKNLSENLLST